MQALDINLDASTPGVRLVLKVIASLAEWERDLLIERTKEGLAHARANNRVGGRPPKLDAAQKEAALNLLAGGYEPKPGCCRLRGFETNDCAT